MPLPNVRRQRILVRKPQCRDEWVVSADYSYVEHLGITLIDPTGTSDLLDGHKGKYVGFLAEPVALDANSQPINVTWSLYSGTVKMEVEDRPGIQHPVVVVEPTFYASPWMAEAETGVSLLKCVGAGAKVIHLAAAFIVGPEVQAAIYHRMRSKGATCLV
jgi:hypothetical protein